LFCSQGCGHPTRFAISQRRNFELFIPHLLSVSQGQMGQWPLSFPFLDLNSRPPPPKPILCNMYNPHNKHRPNTHLSILYNFAEKNISQTWKAKNENKPYTKLTGIVTGHGKTRAYLHRFKIIEEPTCPCGTAEKTTIT